MMFGERIGSGSNNIMSFWTYPWNKNEPFLSQARRRRRQYPTAFKWGLVAFGLVLTAAFWDAFRMEGREEIHVLDTDTGEVVMAKKKVRGSNNTNNKKDLSMAVLVAGSTKRFLFDSFAEHVAKPSTNVEIDFFSTLMMQSGPAYRQSAGYMGHLKGHDKIFNNVLDSNDGDIESIQAKMKAAMASALSGTNANIRALRLMDKPIEDDPVLDKEREKEEKLYNTTFQEKDDLFGQFPGLDKRKKALVRNKAGNRNMIRLFLAQESLWKNEFLSYEAERGKEYDYVLILRDDTMWLHDFDLHKIIATDPTADAYLLSCDAREPKMLPPEINDHGILIKRSKAMHIGAYVTAMITVDLQKCHASVTEWMGKDRGCNSEMILRHVLESNNVKVKEIPQSLMPFQRSVLINGAEYAEGQSDFYCFHKFCQSVDAPLALPPDLQVCKKLTFPEVLPADTTPAGKDTKETKKKAVLAQS